MFKNLANIGSLLRNAQALGEKMQTVAAQLKSQRAIGTAGGGLVEVEVNGLGEVLRVKLDEQLVQRGEREMLEDLVPAAVNQALEKAKALHLEAMKSASEGFDLSALQEMLGNK